MESDKIWFLDYQYAQWVCQPVSFERMSSSFGESLAHA